MLVLLWSFQLRNHTPTLGAAAPYPYPGSCSTLAAAAPHADLQAAGARIGQHHAQQGQESSSGAQLQQQYSNSVAAEHDAAAPQRPQLKPEDAPSDRLLPDNQRAQDLSRYRPLADLVQA